jgi:hypothetical protein
MIEARTPSTFSARKLLLGKAQQLEEIRQKRLSRELLI